MYHARVGSPGARRRYNTPGKGAEDIPMDVQDTDFVDDLRACERDERYHMPLSI